MSTLNFDLCNESAVEIARVPLVSVEIFRQSVIDAVASGARIISFFGQPTDGTAGAMPARLIAVLASDSQGAMALLSTNVNDSYASLTPDCPQAHLFEREIAEQCGITPIGHPWLKPVRRGTGVPAVSSPISCGPEHAEGTHGQDAHATTTHGPDAHATQFFRVEGEEVHEVAVGPVHAGIIEPGHFRFQCHGEEVFNLEISLGYQHRGVERALIGGPGKRTIHYIQTAAGDTTIGHTMAYCQAMEALAACFVPPRALALRGIALELERLANHAGDLGALSGDVGYLPTMSFCGRIRGDALNMTAILCGNRFGRGLVCPGGVAQDIDASDVAQLQQRLDAFEKDIKSAVELLWRTPSVMARFEDTGKLDHDTGKDAGLVGVAARACGLNRDVRKDMPFGIYRYAQMHTATWDSGDVFARAYVRWIEIQRSVEFIRDQLQMLPSGPAAVPLGFLGPGQIAVSMTEGWRGEICHVAITGPAQAGESARLEHYKIVDPSFHNWFGLALALRGQEISDFPLCNKSFNLSYCGHDL
jgi:Ni,Fe-hydrogenase III large subunit